MDLMAMRPHFESVYAEHAGFVRRTLSRRGVRSADLDDVVQDAFVTIHKLLPAFEGRASLETWLHAVTWRVAARYHRRGYSRFEVASTSPELGVEQAGSDWAGADRLHNLLRGLGDEERDLIALHEVGGLSIAELARLTGTARATVRMRIARGSATIARRASLREVQAAPARRAEPRSRSRRPARAQLRDYECSNACFSRHGDTVIAIWRGPAAAQSLENLAEILFSAADEVPGGIALLTVIESTSTPPSRAWREAKAGIVTALGSKLNAAVWAVESPALLSLTPAIINSCLFLSRTPANVRFFGDAALATSWIAQYTPQSAAALDARVADLRRRLDRFDADRRCTLPGGALES